MRLILRLVVSLVSGALFSALSGGAQTLASPPSSNGQPLKIERDSKLVLALAEPLSSATAKKGQAVRLKLNGNWFVNGRIVLPDGTPVEGIVRRVQRPTPGKLGGRVIMTEGSIRLASGRRIQLNIQMPDAEECDDPGPCAVLFGIMTVVEAPLLAIELPVLLVELPKQIKKEHQQERSNDVPPLESNLAEGSMIAATTKHRITLPPD